jgi:STE24 endopeptidase
MFGQKRRITTRRVIRVICGVITAALVVAARAQSPGSNVETYSLPPDQLQRAIAYARARHVLYFAGTAWGFAILGLVLALHLGPRYRNWAEAATRKRILQAYLFAPLLLLTVDLLELPVSMYAHRLAVAYDQSIQPWGSWFWDWTKGELLQFAVAGVVLWILYAVIRRSKRRWWFWFWLAALPMVVFLMFVEPLVIEPMFYDFQPLARKQPALVDQMEKVVARGGLAIPPDRMFEMNASAKLKAVNAYVAGIGASKRVVVWDTTIQKMTTPEILFVFGHEMGHYVLGHIWLGMGLAAGGILISLFLAYHGMTRALARWGGRWGIRGLDDWASLPVLLLAISILGFFGQPVSNYFSRVMEHNADIYGLEVIHGIVPDSSQAAARGFQKLGEISLDDPNPSRFIEFWMYDHPSTRDRVRFAAEYDPWTKGGHPKYVP